MSGLEDRVREAYLAVAELVRDDAVPAGAPTRRADSRRRAVSTSGAKNTSARHARWTVPIRGAKLYQLAGLRTRRPATPGGLYR